MSSDGGCAIHSRCTWCIMSSDQKFFEGGETMFWPLDMICPVCGGVAMILSVEVDKEEGLIFRVTCCGEYLFAVSWDAIDDFCDAREKETSVKH